MKNKNGTTRLNIGQIVVITLAITMLILGVIVVKDIIEKENAILNYNGDIDKQTLTEKKTDLQNRIFDLEAELFYLKQSIGIIEMDLEAINNEMNAKYIQIPNSEWIMRFEFNDSVIDNIEMQGEKNE